MSAINYGFLRSEIPESLFFDLTPVAPEPVVDNVQVYWDYYIKNNIQEKCAKAVVAPFQIKLQTPKEGDCSIGLILFYYADNGFSVTYPLAYAVSLYNSNSLPTAPLNGWQIIDNGNSINFSDYIAADPGSYSLSSEAVVTDGGPFSTGYRSCEILECEFKKQVLDVYGANYVSYNNAVFWSSFNGAVSGSGCEPSSELLERISNAMTVQECDAIMIELGSQRAKDITWITPQNGGYRIQIPAQTIMETLGPDGPIDCDTTATTPNSTGIDPVWRELVMNYCGLASDYSYDNFSRFINDCNNVIDDTMKFGDSATFNNGNAVIYTPVGSGADAEGALSLAQDFLNAYKSHAKKYAPFVVPDNPSEVKARYDFGNNISSDSGVGPSLSEKVGFVSFDNGLLEMVDYINQEADNRNIIEDVAIINNDFDQEMVTLYTNMTIHELICTTYDQQDLVDKLATYDPNEVCYPYSDKIAKVR